MHLLYNEHPLVYVYCLREPLEVKLEYFDVPPRMEIKYLGNSMASLRIIGYEVNLNNFLYDILT